jgi:ABC-type transporter Mla MlaB component
VVLDAAHVNDLSSSGMPGSVVLDLTMVEAIDASGIGVLLSLERWARASGMSLKLMNPTLRVRKVFELRSSSRVALMSLAPQPRGLHTTRGTDRKTVNPSSPLAITSGTPPSGTVGKAYDVHCNQIPPCNVLLFDSSHYARRYGGQFRNLYRRTHYAGKRPLSDVVP